LSYLLFRSTSGPKQILAAMPIEIIYRVAPEDWAVSVKSNSEEIPVFSWRKTGWGSSPELGQAITIRDAFDAVKSPSDALSFLSHSGPFRYVRGSVSWTVFQGWQAFFRNQRIKGVRSTQTPQWVDGDELDHIVGNPKIKIDITLKAKVPLAKVWIECASVVEVIAASIFVEQLKGVKIRICPWCQRLFEPQTKRGTYCGHACAHSAGQKRRRSGT